MRIAHVVESLNPAAGGPPVVAVGQAAAEADLGAEVRLIAQAARPGAPGHDADVLLRAAPGIEAVRIDRVPTRNVAAWLAGGWRQLDRLVAEADVVHLHGVWEPMLVAAARAAQRRGVPYVLQPHGYLHPWSLAQKALAKRVLLAALYRRLLDDAAALVLSNDVEASAVRDLGLQAPVVIVPNGVFPDQIRAQGVPGRFRADLAALGDAPFILFLGRLHRMKGLDFLAAAFAQLAEMEPDVHLVVMGPDGGARRAFERQVREAGLRERVHVLPPIYGPGKYEAMRDAACFCLPSRREGHSVAVLEALAVGTPVVISESCHFPEVHEADAGRVVPLEPAAIATALREIVTDETARARMSRNARRLVDGRYTWTHAAARLLDELARLTKASPPAARSRARDPDPRAHAGEGEGEGRSSAPDEREDEDGGMRLKNLRRAV